MSSSSVGAPISAFVIRLPLGWSEAIERRRPAPVSDHGSCPLEPAPNASAVVQVHVIEVSDLKGKSASGACDPTVYASCLGVTKHTRVRRGVNSAVFDEVLYINLPSITR